MPLSTQDTVPPLKLSEIKALFIFFAILTPASFSLYLPSSPEIPFSAKISISICFILAELGTVVVSLRNDMACNQVLHTLCLLAVSIVAAEQLPLFNHPEAAVRTAWILEILLIFIPCCNGVGFLHRYYGISRSDGDWAFARANVLELIPCWPDHWRWPSTSGSQSNN
ncbi:hypothetical protein C8J56DRAFT_496331 [Mycena floridula]|nr:hypothetical protein C8J56DRAFT_496331 [Mycena floridula]